MPYIQQPFFSAFERNGSYETEHSINKILSNYLLPVHTFQIADRKSSSETRSNRCGGGKFLIRNSLIKAASLVGINKLQSF